MAKSDLIQFLSVQYQQKIKQVEDSTRLYFQSIVILGAGIAAAVGALVAVQDWTGIIARVVVGGTPFFLVSWFGCFLFIYWEHHMIRISLDYSEKLASEALGIQNKNFLYHEDFLGVFNQADFPPRNYRWPEAIRFKSVQWVFVLIAFFGPLIFLGCGWLTLRTLIGISLWFALAYGVPLLVFPGILLFIHINCVSRERKLKKALGIVSKWEGDNLRIDNPNVRIPAHPDH